MFTAWNTFKAWNVCDFNSFFAVCTSIPIHQTMYDDAAADRWSCLMHREKFGSIRQKMFNLVYSNQIDWGHRLIHAPIEVWVFDAFVRNRNPTWQSCQQKPFPIKSKCLVYRTDPLTMLERSTTEKRTSTTSQITANKKDHVISFVCSVFIRQWFDSMWTRDGKQLTGCAHENPISEMVNF